jgi:hypothetical protein
LCEYVVIGFFTIGRMLATWPQGRDGTGLANDVFVVVLPMLRDGLFCFGHDVFLMRCFGLPQATELVPVLLRSAFDLRRHFAFAGPQA